MAAIHKSAIEGHLEHITEMLKEVLQHNAIVMNKLVNVETRDSRQIKPLMEMRAASGAIDQFAKSAKACLDEVGTILATVDEPINCQEPSASDEDNDPRKDVH